jgi:FkbM family methyltransferase
VGIREEDLVGLAEPWTRLHRRVADVPGAVVDLGCATWDWSRRFFGEKHVVAADPFEADPAVDRVDFFQGIVSVVRGRAQISREGTGSSTRRAANAVEFPAITLADLLERYRVDQVAALKINTEGSEYELLINLSERQIRWIDQIAVSFHDFIGIGIGSPRAVEAVLGYLRNWYDVAMIDGRWSWYLCVRRS